jgi:FecR protein
MTDLDEEHALSEISTLARRAAEAPPTDEVHATGRARVIHTAERFAIDARVNRGSIGHSAAVRTAIAVAALAGALAAVIALRSRVERPLRYEVSGIENHLAQNYVRAPEAASADVRFSDGSDVLAAPASRLRVEQTWKNGARILVERGSLTAHVVHGSDSKWSFAAGPFEVHVTGTRLSIVWDPESERIDVTLHEGSVEIDSPIGPSRYAVTGGHSFHASLRDKVIQMDGTPLAAPADGRTSGEPAPTPRASSAPETASKVETSAPRLRPADSAEKNDAESESWSKLVRRGAFRDVVAAAEASGVPACIAKCSAQDLRALADAAHYTGKADLSTRVLLSLRARFGQDRQGAAAAFLLGRSAESAGDFRAADRWYGTYLSEAPEGEFAPDARAGRMRAAKAEARKLAGPE